MPVETADDRLILLADFGESFQATDKPMAALAVVRRRDTVCSSGPAVKTSNTVFAVQVMLS